MAVHLILCSEGKRSCWTLACSPHFTVIFQMLFFVWAVLLFAVFSQSWVSLITLDHTPVLFCWLIVFTRSSIQLCLCLLSHHLLYKKQGRINLQVSSWTVIGKKAIETCHNTPTCFFKHCSIFSLNTCLHWENVWTCVTGYPFANDQACLKRMGLILLRTSSALTNSRWWQYLPMYFLNTMQ